MGLTLFIKLPKSKMHKLKSSVTDVAWVRWLNSVSKAKDPFHRQVMNYFTVTLFDTVVTVLSAWPSGAVHLVSAH